MNTRYLLEKAVVKNPYDRTAVRVLADFIHEHHSITFGAACKVAARLRRDARNAREVSEAVSALSVRGHDGDALRAAIEDYCGRADARGAPIYTAPGSRPPRFYAWRGPRHVSVQWAPSILVGARFVLLLARLRREVQAIEQVAHANIATSLFGW